jgi:hypothetical protein
MASFAKIGLNGKVIEVQSVVNEVLHDSNGVEQENIGIDFLTKLTGWSIWKQTSFNTVGGVHKLGGTPLRKNFAGIGFTYDEDRDAFIPPRPYASWTLNETTCLWESPVSKPELTEEQIDNNNYYRWNEDNQTWDLIE